MRITAAVMTHADGIVSRRRIKLEEVELDAAYDDESAASASVMLATDEASYVSGAPVAVMVGKPIL